MHTIGRFFSFAVDAMLFPGFYLHFAYLTKAFGRRGDLDLSIVFFEAGTLSHLEGGAKYPFL